MHVVTLTRTNVLDDQLPELVRVPTHSEAFKNVALRDLALHEKHAACVDARGDVYQWGDDFFGGEAGSSHAQPQLTLKGKVCGCNVSLPLCHAHRHTVSCRNRTLPSYNLPGLASSPSRPPVAYMS